MEDQNTNTGKRIAEGAGGVGGAAAGAAIGSLAGPIGTVIGAIAGAVGGWWTGRAAADAANSIDATDDDYYRERHSTSGGSGDFDTARPAFHLGHVAGQNPEYQGRSFDEIEPHLQAGWSNEATAQSGDWNDVRSYARDAYERGQEHRLTLAEEQLAVGKRSVQEGEVAVRKHVDTHHVEQQVELVREEISVERRPLSADANVTASAIGEAEIRVPLMREEAVVEKRTVPIEEVVVRKSAVSDTQTVGADLRRETLDMDEHVDRER